MRHSFWNTTPTIAKINVTPIIDVALVLVIILLITAPMMAVNDLDVKLPEAQTRGAENDVRITISLGSSGEIALDEKIVSLEAFPTLLRSRLAHENEDMLIVIRADEDTPHHMVRSVLSQARAAGAKHLAIATRQKVKVDL